MRLRSRLIVLSAGFAVLSVFAAPGAEAQSPPPGYSFYDYDPAGSITNSTAGNVIEGLGIIGSCGSGNYSNYSLSNVEKATVKSINSGALTITEVSPQSSCVSSGSLSAYESMLDSLITYIKNHASSWKTLWLGVMYDEEPNYDTPSDYYALNQYTGADLEARTPNGYDWWFNEIGGCGGGKCYSQTQWDYLVHGCNSSGGNCYYSFDAPQVYNSNFAADTNGAGDNFILVTWWTGSSYPYNTESYADGAINGAPWYTEPASSIYPHGAKYWDNHYRNA